MLLLQVPVMEDMTHDQHVCGRQRITEEITDLEAEPILQSEMTYVFLEHRLHRRKVELATDQVLMRKRELHTHAALRTTDVAERLDLFPWKFSGNHLRRTHADAGHGR